MNQILLLIPLDIKGWKTYIYIFLTFCWFRSTVCQMSPPQSNIQSGFRSPKVMKSTGAFKASSTKIWRVTSNGGVTSAHIVSAINHKNTIRICLHTFARIDLRFVPEIKALIYPQRSTTEAESIQSMNQRLTKVFYRRFIFFLFQKVWAFYREALRKDCKSCWKELRTPSMQCTWSVGGDVFATLRTSKLLSVHHILS